jgi:hypothetical protein
MGPARPLQRPYAATSAILFNLCLLGGPIMAVNAVQATLSGEVMGYSPSEATLELTRQEMDKAFAALIPGGEDRREYWAALVNAELDAQDIPAARGFVLAAEAMLGGSDAAALRAAARDRSGGGDITEDARIAAALTLLPAAVRARYERAVSPLGAALRAAGEFAEGAVTGEADSTGAIAGVVTSDFFVLGDVRDLTLQSMRWVNNEPVDPFILTISGVGLTLTAATVMTAGQAAPARAGASVLKAAKRSGQINPRLLRHFEDRLEAAVPQASLRRELGGLSRQADEFADVATPTTGQADGVLGAFQRAMRSDGMAALADDLTQVQAIAQRTSPGFAVKVLRTAEDATDLRRARQLVDAGGDRAAALTKHGGIKALRLAKTAVKWTNELMAWVGGLIGMLGALLLTAISVLVKSFTYRAKAGR